MSDHFGEKAREMWLRCATEGALCGLFCTDGADPAASSDQDACPGQRCGLSMGEAVCLGMSCWDLGAQLAGDKPASQIESRGLVTRVGPLLSGSP